MVEGLDGIVHERQRSLRRFLDSRFRGNDGEENPGWWRSFRWILAAGG